MAIRKRCIADHLLLRGRESIIANGNNVRIVLLAAIPKEDEWRVLNIYLQGEYRTTDSSVTRVPIRIEVITYERV